MHPKQQPHSLLLSILCRAATTALARAIMFALIVLLTQSAQAQTFNVIYNFPSQSAPSTALAMDLNGNLYGMMRDAHSSVTAYRLLKRSSAWVLSRLYTFPGGSDGFDFEYALTPGLDGRVYGTTKQGGEGTCGHQYEFQGCGTIFVLTPPARPCPTVACPWTKTILHIFTGRQDGGIPTSPLVFDQAGNLYGVTYYGGYIDDGECWAGCGTVYKISPNGTFQVIYAFLGNADGLYPEGGLTFDSAGNIYGTMIDGVFELMPSGALWAEKVIASLLWGGWLWSPHGGVVFDQSGNLYGTAPSQAANAGAVFQLTPIADGWTANQLYVFYGYIEEFVYGVTVNAAGEVDGAQTWLGPYGCGYIYRLTPDGSGWTYSSLHDFTCSGSDGGNPDRPLLSDANGNLWGTAHLPGTQGLVWEITP